MATQSTRNSNDRRIDYSSERTQQYRGQRQPQHGEGSFFERGNDQLREMVADHEGRTLLVAAAFGFGIGLAIGCGIAQSRQPERWTDRLAAEGIGRRLMERIDSLLPESISSKLHG